MSFNLQWPISSLPENSILRDIIYATGSHEAKITSNESWIRDKATVFEKYILLSYFVKAASKVIDAKDVANALTDAAFKHALARNDNHSIPVITAYLDRQNMTKEDALKYLQVASPQILRNTQVTELLPKFKDTGLTVSDLVANLKPSQLQLACFLTNTPLKAIEPTIRGTIVSALVPGALNASDLGAMAVVSPSVMSAHVDTIKNNQELKDYVLEHAFERWVKFQYPYDATRPYTQPATLADVKRAIELGRDPEDIKDSILHAFGVKDTAKWRKENTIKEITEVFLVASREFKSMQEAENYVQKVTESRNKTQQRGFEL